MIAPGDIAFDIDGVFANTMGLFLKIARTDYDVNHITYQDIDQYFLEDCLDVDPELIKVIIDRILEGDFETELEPVEGAVEVLSDIAEAGPLLFVTARPKLSLVKTWVQSMLPGCAHDIEVVATGTFERKVDVLSARGIQHFVDDCLEVCFMLHDHDIVPILFNQPWNRSRHSFKEVSTWGEIRALIDLQPS